MPTADLLPSGLVPEGLTPWLLVAGAVALYLAYRAVRFGARLVSLGVAAALFLGAGPATGGTPPFDLPWSGPAPATPQDAPRHAPRAGDAEAAGEPVVPPPAGAFRAVVTSVGDGDSLRVRVTDPGDTPAARDAEIELRLLRIDAPELARDGRPADCLADEAASALERTVPPGAEVLGAYDLERRDPYDRELVHLWTADGRWVNGAMLAAGLARVVTFPPNTGYEDDVRALEAGARSARRGIWDAGVCPG